MFKTIKNAGTAEVIEKKSKFIANIFYVESISEAEKIIEKIKKEYHDARHSCYAYRILEENGTLERQSDDGEPARNCRSTYAWNSSKERSYKYTCCCYKIFWRHSLGKRRAS